MDIFILGVMANTLRKILSIFNLQSAYN